MNNAELISMVRSIAKHGADWRINWVLNRAADELEAAEKRIAELERILKAVQENSGINFRLWQEAEARMQTVTNCHGLEEGER